MAHAFAAVNKVDGAVGGVTYSATTQAKDVELNIDTAVITTREDALLALEKLTIALTTSAYPPA